MYWRIEMLGSYRVLATAESGLPPGTEARGFRSRKTAALLAFMALHQRRRHSRAELGELFWPDSDEESARGSLSAALSSLRHELERPPVPAGSVIVGERELIWLERVTSDVADFEAAVRDAQREPDVERRISRLERACALYAPSLLPGLEGDWIPARQASLSDGFLGAAEGLLGLYSNADRVQDALQIGLLALEEDPARANTRAHLMRLYARDGRPHEALKLFHDLERLLWSEYKAAAPPELHELARDIRASMVSQVSVSPATTVSEVPLRPAPSAGRLVKRAVDDTLRRAVEQREGLVLLKGARETGKTTTIGKALRGASRAGDRVAVTDLGSLSGAKLSGTSEFLTALAGELADHVGLDPAEAEAAVAPDAPGRSFRRYLRDRVLDGGLPPLVWAIDDFDRVLTRDCCAEILGLFRSWYNERAREGAGPWHRLTLVLAYSTEVHLHVRDLNQSPFNVGRTVELGDLSDPEIDGLNQLYGSPLDAPQLARLRAVVDGHPGLLKRSFEALTAGTVTLDCLEQQARQSGGIYAGHLQRLGAGLGRDPELLAVIAQVLTGRGCPRDDEFLRLRSAGILAGASPEEARIRCGLYREHLGHRLRATRG